ncbi:MAG: ABC transporter ATP-binding protein [Synergistaceae bacterium]|nr:ABC transporter ATP-binding protein [Synergistaceae bacterium]MBQ6111262.1 ABC transporter ATP-binding protein [Synergistaceae bacterium]MBR0250215.1 ABC transporter ATP-binding protein [Synergistaceae bacterium]
MNLNHHGHVSPREYVVEVRNLSFSYGESQLVLSGINFNASSGEFICFLGLSGCGKSTLLRLLAGLEKPSSGEILLNGNQIKGAGLDRGVVFQDYGLFPWMTAGDNIRLALEQKFPDWTKKKIKDTAIHSLIQVGLDESVYRKLPKALSGGMKQRCAIAQAFAINPPVLLMDEPFGALDAVTRSRLQDMLLSLWSSDESRKTIFFVTHDVDEAIYLAQRIIIIGHSPGRIIYDCVIPEDKKPTRETQFEDLYLLRLRNELIRMLNSDAK